MASVTTACQLVLDALKEFDRVRLESRPGSVEEAAAGVCYQTVREALAEIMAAIATVNLEREAGGDG